AIAISKRFGSVLYLLTVVDISTIRPPGMLLGIVLNKKMKKLSSKISESIILKTNKRLKNEVEFCRKNDVKTYYQIMKGYAVDAILKFALKNNIDLIVMGSKGLSGFGKLLTLGSVSRRVSEEANCPVMLVR
ncbi:MAG TPA: universal stress protein, partial [Nitrosopumilaceae archaeon]|nr:universal stress protein [Nitrosopumilaceae archaeon]